MKQKILLCLMSLLIASSSLWAQKPKENAKPANTIPAGDEFLNLLKTVGAKNYGECSPIKPVDYDVLIIRGPFVLDGTGAPPFGPVDIFIENGVIKSVVAADPGAGVPLSQATSTENKRVKEIQAKGKYVMPGMIDCHAHNDQPLHSLFGPVPSQDYVFKLLLAHGVTSVRECGSLGGMASELRYKEQSAKNEIAAPRVVVMPAFPIGVFKTENDAKQWVRDVKARGADGVKFLGGEANMVKAAYEEIKAQKMTSASHHAQLSVMEVDALQSAQWGLSSIEHWYGIPEAMFEDRTVQHYPLDYSYTNEQDRFSKAGELWDQSSQPGSEGWNKLLNDLLATGVSLDPTFSIYEAGRDVEAVRSRPWFKEYSFPALDRCFQPNHKIHGSFFYDWTTEMEINWKKNFTLWMQFVNDFKNRGGRVTVGSDAGLIYNLQGFGYVRGLEMLQEAGFHPLEVLRAATLNGAELLNISDKVGTVVAGKRADLLVLDENPLANFKLLYGTGQTRLNPETQKLEQVRALRYTIKDGVVFEVDNLLADVRKMVQDLKDLEAKK